MSSRDEAPERIVLLCRLVLAVADPRRSDLDAAVAACAGSDALATGDVEEALLLAIPYCGFPASVEALGRWREVGSAGGGTTPPAVSHPGEVGHRVFDEIYGELAPRVLRELARREPRLEIWIREFAYGQVMGGSALPMGDLEALGVAALLAQERRSPLHSHLRGARRVGWSQAGLHALVEALDAGISAPITAYAHDIIDTL